MMVVAVERDTLTQVFHGEIELTLIECKLTCDPMCRHQLVQVSGALGKAQARLDMLLTLGQVSADVVVVRETQVCVEFAIRAPLLGGEIQDALEDRHQVLGTTALEGVYGGAQLRKQLEFKPVQRRAVLRRLTLRPARNGLDDLATQFEMAPGFGHGGARDGRFPRLAPIVDGPQMFTSLGKVAGQDLRLCLSNLGKDLLHSLRDL